MGFETAKVTQRLKDVVSRIYRLATTGVRQVFALSRGEAERLPRLPSVAVISVMAPERPPAALEGFEHLLRLSFADVDFLNPDLSRRAREKAANAFTAEQARFVDMEQLCNANPSVLRVLLEAEMPSKKRK